MNVTRRKLHLFVGVSGPCIALCSILGLLIGSGTYTFYYAEGASYLSNDPKACVNCHIMRDQYDGWQKGSHHAAATCNDCHVPHDFVRKYLAKANSGYWHSKGFTLQDFHEPIQMHDRSRDILQENCIRCHQSLVSGIAGHDEKSDRPIRCVHCHDSVGHGVTR